MPTQVVNPEILPSQLPSIAVTSVNTYADISDRDADTNVQVGDIGHVLSPDSMYVYNGSTWIGFTASATLASCTDTQLTNLQNAHALVYQASSSKWKNRYILHEELINAGTLSHSQLESDIASNTSAISSNTTSITTNAATMDSHITNSSIHITSVSEMNDVQLSTPIHEEVLMYNQDDGKWENITPRRTKVWVNDPDTVNNPGVSIWGPGALVSYRYNYAAGIGLDVPVDQRVENGDMCLTSAGNLYRLFVPHSNQWGFACQIAANPTSLNNLYDSIDSDTQYQGDGGTLIFNSGTGHYGYNYYDHNNLLNKGSNTHSQIDTALASHLSRINMLDCLNTTGDLLYRSNSGYARLACGGSTGLVLTTDTGNSNRLTWSPPSTLLGLTTAGDILVNTASGPIRLPIGNHGQVAMVNTSDSCKIRWTDIPNQLYMLTTAGDILYYDSSNYNRLPCGTNGQILSTNTSLSGKLEWVTPSSGGGGFTSPLTTKGDIHTYSTTDARLPVGSNNAVLVADSAASTGVSWDDRPYTRYISRRTVTGSNITVSTDTTLYNITVGKKGAYLVSFGVRANPSGSSYPRIWCEQNSSGSYSRVGTDFKCSGIGSDNFDSWMFFPINNSPDNYWFQYAGIVFTTTDNCNIRVVGGLYAGTYIVIDVYNDNTNGSGYLSAVRMF